MKFATKKPEPVVIGVEIDGSSAGEIRFYPTDLAVRQAFFDMYEDLKAYKTADITPATDENGVSNVDVEYTRELKRFTDFLAERFDRVFGENSASLVMGGVYNFAPLVRFICENARYFKAETQRLISEYTAPDESGVME